MALKESNSSINNTIIHKTLSMYDGKIDKIKRLNHFLSQYSDPDTMSDSVKKYFDLIITNGGFFDINSFNFAMVYQDVCNGNITLEFASGLFAIKYTEDFKKLLDYFNITEDNVHLYTYNSFVVRGILKEIFLNGPIREISSSGRISSDDLCAITKYMIDKINGIVDNTKFLNGDVLKEIINSGEKEIDITEFFQ